MNVNTMTISNTCNVDIDADVEEPLDQAEVKNWSSHGHVEYRLGPVCRGTSGVPAMIQAEQQESPGLACHLTRAQASRLSVETDGVHQLSLLKAGGAVGGPAAARQSEDLDQLEVVGQDQLQGRLAGALHVVIRNPQTDNNKITN